MRLPIALLLVLAACSGPKAGEPAVAPTANAVADVPSPAPIKNGAVPPNDPAILAEQAAYVGRWVGVEGMYLVVRKRSGTRFVMEMQYDLDHKGTFEGRWLERETAGGPGIAFTRGGEDLILRPSDGDATGLKYLAGKKTCLTVKPGEGYCRD